MDQIVTSPLRHFQAELKEGRLAYQVSAEGRAIFYPRVGPDLSWRVSAGRGTVYATTVVHSSADNYNVALVDCDEGFRMMSRIDEIAPDQVRIGMRVRFRPAVSADGTPVATFVPEGI